MSVSSSATAEGVRSVTLWVVGLCWAVTVFDGFDLFVYGAVVPALLQDPAWVLTPAQVGVIGSYALVGMLFGALTVGTLTDLIGRRKSIILCLVWFSVTTGLCAFAPTPEVFGVLRFLAGLGIGGLIPTASALTMEYAPPERRNFFYLTMMTGHSVGGILAALLAIPVIPAFGWRAMFLIALAPLVLVLPLTLKFLPESLNFLLAKGRRGEAEALARRHGLSLEPRTVSSVEKEERTAVRTGKLNPLSTILSKNYIGATVAFWSATFMGLLLIYGLTAWLPQIMIESGYPLASALSFLLVLNVGAIVGKMFAGAAADRFGTKPVCGLAFLAVAASLCLLSVSMPTLLMYAVVALAGIGTFSGQDLINAYVGKHYPASSRATALGWSLGVGRLGAICGPVLGGLLVGAGLAVPWGFYAFALPGLLAALIILALVPRSPTAVTLQSAPVTPEVSPSR